jgi:AraC-like DNA-binding protein
MEHNDGYMGFFPPGGMLDAYTPEGYGNATLTVRCADFLAAVERSFPEIPEHVLKHGAGVRIGAVEQRRLRGLLSAIIAGMDSLADPLAGETMRQHLERELLAAFLTALRGGCRPPVPSPGQRKVGRQRRLRQVRDYISDHLHEPVTLEDLCVVSGLSRRGVELLFQDLLGIGPTALLRHQRLHGVRRTLLATPSGAGVVKESALQWGFWHMGHFSNEYRSLFGELPSETSARAAHS